MVSVWKTLLVLAAITLRASTGSCGKPAGMTLALVKVMASRVARKAKDIKED